MDTTMDMDRVFTSMMEAVGTAYNKMVSLLKTKTTLNILSCSGYGCASMTWKIPNFSSILENNEKVLSRAFTCCDAEWALGLLHFQEDSEEKIPQSTTKHPEINFCLVRISSRVKVHNISFKIGFENKKRAIEKIYNYGTECEMENTHWYPLVSLHWKELELCTNDNTLTFSFEFKPSYSTENTAEIFGAVKKESTLKENAGISTLSYNLGALLGKENYDVTLQVEERKFHAHKLILGARSPVFDAMFEHNMLENRTNVVTLSDIQPLTFKDVLQYVYTGRIRNLSINKAIDLYKASDVYDLRDLKALCMETMLAGINLQNACELAVVANIYNDGKVMDSVVRFAHENSSAFLASREWQDLLSDDAKLATQILSATTQLAIKRQECY